MSAGGSSSSQDSMSETFLNPAQAPFLQGLWSAAQNQITPTQIGQNAGISARPGAQATRAGMGALTSIMQNPLAGQTSVVSGLQKLGDLGAATAASQPALNTLAGLMNPGKQIATQTASLKSGLGQLFSQELNPAIRGNAIAAGGFGGGRQGVAQGQAVGQVSDAFTQGLGDITASANAQAGQAAQGYGGIMQAIRSGALGAQGALADVFGNARSAAAGAATALPALGEAFQQFGTAGNQARVQALQALAAIYGNPNVLARSQSGSDSSGWQFGFGS